VVARLTDLGLGQAVRDLFRAGGDDQEVPVPLVRGVVAVLQDWQPAPDGIVGFASASRPVLVDSLVSGLARHLGVPVLGRVAVVDDQVPPGQGAANSAQRVAAVSRRARLALDVPVEGRRVLLVDDQVVTGWSMTLAARWLRQAGASAVLPLALASQA
jgi:ATP-dependent DNA helicase RecQ